MGLPAINFSGASGPLDSKAPVGKLQLLLPCLLGYSLDEKRQQSLLPFGGLQDQVVEVPSSKSGNIVHVWLFSPDVAPWAIEESSFYLHFAIALLYNPRQDHPLAGAVGRGAGGGRGLCFLGHKAEMISQSTCMSDNTLEPSNLFTDTLRHQLGLLHLHPDWLFYILSRERTSVSVSAWNCISTKPPWSEAISVASNLPQI